MPVLAAPETSQLLMIDPVSHYLHQLDDDIGKWVSGQFHRVSLAADFAGVPRYYAVSHKNGSPEDFLSKPCEKRQTRVFQFERDRPVWSNTDMLLSMQKENREQLFICGFWFDDVVTAAALEAQPLGFNTHVIVDLSLAYKRQQRQSALDRLNQYCIAPITVQNLLYEWMVKTEEEHPRKNLETLWQEQRTIDEPGTSADATGLS